MRSVLFLLIFSLTTGCEAKSEAKGCLEGWAEFASKKPKSIGNNKVDPRRTDIRSTMIDKWEKKGNISLYHDTKSKKLTVAIKQCKSRCTSDGEELKLVVEKDGCPGPFNQTAYITAKTTITCDYPGEKNGPSVEFFCKDNDLICEDILSTNSSSKSNGKFTLTETSSGFNISISHVSSNDAGVYWCGVETRDGHYRAALRSTRLKVEGIKSFEKDSTIGKNLTYYCTFRNNTPIEIFICKGEDPSICQRLVTSTQPDKSGKFSMKRSESKGQQSKNNFTITVREVTAEDGGIYWCGGESKAKTRRNTFFHKFTMTIVPTPTPPAMKNDGSHMLITVLVLVAVLLLVLFVLIFTLIYKRFSRSKNTRNSATAQNIREDYIYAEIQERVQNPDSGDAVNTIYSTANFPTDPSASLHYSTITFQNRSNKAGGDELIVKPRSSCEYSAVKCSDSPIYCTVNGPSRSSQDPLYSTVTNKQYQ